MREDGPEAVLQLSRIREVAAALAADIVRTPVVRWTAPHPILSKAAALFVKLELLQRTGSFKPRGALNVLRHLDDPGRGVTAFSAGNHALALAYAARRRGIPARVVMPRRANPFRVARCRAEGAEVEFGETIGELVERVAKLQDDGWTPVHPFEGEHTAAGTATVGLEFAEDVPALDLLVVPVGGGGLIAGVASAITQLQPACRIIGVEPVGADGMAQSLRAGRPLPEIQVDTIADSLGAPLHLPYSFGLVRRHVHELVQVSDIAMRRAMRTAFEGLKLAVEPACAAGIAALEGPLADRLDGARVGLVACGANIDVASFASLIDVNEGAG